MSSREARFKQLRKQDRLKTGKYGALWVNEGLDQGRTGS
jgi:hypothetical protein